MDNMRIDYLIDIISKQDKSFLLIGKQGTLIMIKGYCNRYELLWDIITEPF